MMDKLWPLLVLVIPFQSIHAQEVKHAPMVEQCRADRNLWLPKLKIKPAMLGIYLSAPG
jgi:hypothetical protein